MVHSWCGIIVPTAILGAHRRAEKTKKSFACSRIFTKIPAVAFASFSTLSYITNMFKLINKKVGKIQLIIR